MKKLLLFSLPFLLFGCSNSLDDVDEFERQAQIRDSYDLSAEVTLRSSESEIDTPLLNALVDLYEHLDEVNTQSSGNLFNFLDTNNFDYQDALNYAQSNFSIDTTTLNSLAQSVETAISNLSDEEASSTIEYYLSTLSVSSTLQTNNQGRRCFWCTRTQVVNTSTQNLGYCWCKSTTYIFWINVGDAYHECPC